MSRFWLAVVLSLLPVCGFAQPSQRFEHVIIKTPKPYARVVAALQALGGRVREQYKYVDAVSAEIPADAMQTVRNLVGAQAMEKDLRIPTPRAVDVSAGRKVRGQQMGAVLRVQHRGARVLQPAAVRSYAARPNAYAINNVGIAVDSLHANGLTGAGITVAVVDSGIRPGFPHLEADNSVIGGIDLVGDGRGFSHLENDGHGTFVAGMISANVEFDLTGPFLEAIRAHAPEAIIPGTPFVPMIGSAPAASIYVVRVFGTDASLGAPTSRLLAAIQHIIDLRRDYDRGRPGGIKIDVANLSLGNATVAAGRDLLDRSTDALLENGIIPIVSAGNVGPSSLTISSPGSAMTALTVGAASNAAHERIMAEVSYGPGTGTLYRPFAGTQTAWFSSRGPNADGRIDPDVVANGNGNFGQGYGFVDPTTGMSEISLSSGSSFSAPTVAGIAAVLREAFPQATARQIRNAIVLGANPHVLQDNSTMLDQGRGYVNAEKAFSLLAAGRVPDNLPQSPKPSKFVAVNVEKQTHLNVHKLIAIERASKLKPGERKDVLYQIAPNTDRVFVAIANVKPALPKSQQNQFFGDDLVFGIHTAKTSSIGNFGDYLASGFTSGTTHVFEDPESGIMRITLVGNTTNAGPISADVLVFSLREPEPRVTTRGKIRNHETIVFPVTIPSKTRSAEFRLVWEEDWSNYPTSDIDMILVDPTGATSSAGATLRDPEKVVVPNPKPGTWLVVMDGFEIPTGSDKYELRVLVDGKILK